MTQDTTPASQEAAQNIRNQERHVEELVGPDDYWLTITDAARATRRQDVSIRRWISKGLLPVKRQHVGLNQRTRLVRASDLAALTPIIDPSAAISTDLGRLDLTSIPVQQSQIKESQQHIIAQLEKLNDYVNKETDTIQQQVLAQQTALTSLQADLERRTTIFHDAIEQQRANTSASFEGLRDDIRFSSAQTIAQAEAMNLALSDQLNMLRRTVEQRIVELYTTAQETATYLQHLIDTCVTTIQHERLAREQLAQLVASIPAQLSQQHQQLEQECIYRQQLTVQSAQMAADIASQQQNLEVAHGIHTHLRNHIAELQSQFTENQQLTELRYSQLLDLQAQQQMTQQALQFDLTSLTHHLQGHEIHHKDYVKLMERLDALERTMEEVHHSAEREQKLGKDHAE